MTAMSEREVISQMDLAGLDTAIEPIALLLESLGYHEVASELRQRWADYAPTEDGVFF